MIPFRERLSDLLAEKKVEGAQAWLAKMSCLEPSTISRLLHSDRVPSRETLEAIAPALGVTLDVLVQGTTAAERLRNGADFVSAEQFQHAVNTMLDFERRTNETNARLREAKDALDAETARAKRAAAERDDALARADALSRKNGTLEADLANHREALKKAVADICQLQANIGELKAMAEASKSTSRATALLAGIAAITGIATAAHYLGDDDEPAPRPKKARTAKKGGRP